MGVLEVSLPPPAWARSPAAGRGSGARVLAEIAGGEQDKVAGGQEGVWPSVGSPRRGQAWRKQQKPRSSVTLRPVDGQPPGVTAGDVAGS